MLGLSVTQYLVRLAIAFIILGAGVLVCNTAIGKLVCPESVRGAQSSPNSYREFRAEIRAKNCAGSSGAVNVVLIERLGGFFDLSRTAFGLPEDTQSTRIEWLEGDHLVIHYGYCKEVENPVPDWRGITISYIYEYRAPVRTRCPGPNA